MSGFLLPCAPSFSRRFSDSHQSRSAAFVSRSSRSPTRTNDAFVSPATLSKVASGVLATTLALSSINAPYSWIVAIADDYQSSSTDISAVLERRRELLRAAREKATGESTTSSTAEAPPTKSTEGPTTEKSRLDLLTESVKQQREKYDEEIAKSQKLTPRRDRGSTLSLPELPKFSAPELPKFSAPELPKFSAPELPKSLLPGGDTKSQEPSSKTESPASKSVPQTAPLKPPVLAPLQKDAPSVPKPFVEQRKVEPEVPSTNIEPLKSFTVPRSKDTPPADKAQTTDSVLDMMRKKYSGNQSQPALPQPTPVRPAAPAPAPSVSRSTPATPVMPKDVVPTQKAKRETSMRMQKRKGPLPLWLTHLLMLGVFGGLVYSVTVLFDSTSKVIGSAYKATDRFLLGLRFSYNRTKSDQNDRV